MTRVLLMMFRALWVLPLGYVGLLGGSTYKPKELLTAEDRPVLL